MDREGGILYGSPSVERVLGFSPQELMGTNCLDLMHPDDREKARAAFAYKTLRPGRADERIQLRVGHKNGSWRYLEAVGAAGKNRSGQTVLVTNLRDITDRKETEDRLIESEERYRAVIDNSNDGIVLGKGGIHIYANKRFLDMFGFEGPEDIIGKSVAAVVHPDDADRVMDYNLRRQRGEDAPSRYEFKGIRTDGAVVHVDVSVAAMMYRGEQVSLAFLRDITERRTAEEKIKASLREKEVLLKEIHHRVKNNLQVISSLLKLQASYFKDPKTREAFNESQSRIRTIALVHQKLYQSEDLSRIDFAGYVRDLSRDLFRTYGVDSAKIRLIINVSHSFLDIDRAMPCGLIISELLSNSLKHAFAERETGRISIDLTRENGSFILRVGDDGVGLPVDMDFRDTESLGLQLVNTLVEQLDGTIELLEGEGTGFVIAFKG